ncbi:helix-turn-helix domain-containing protein [Nonomuraea rubra]|uniref:helix-turn-helix domain-containing protein n=1 Tax=Nonomuraea rubra TaxID=46180 RepID=UPI0033D86D45
MSVKYEYRWHLRKVMADRGLYATTDLRPLLAQRGFWLSQSQVYRLVAERPVRLNLRLLMALLDILGCTMADLIEPIPASGDRAAATAVSRFAPPRPKRANVLPD